jgi:hypothetical protein
MTTSDREEARMNALQGQENTSQASSVSLLSLRKTPTDSTGLLRGLSGNQEPPADVNALRATIQQYTTNDISTSVKLEDFGISGTNINQISTVGVPGVGTSQNTNNILENVRQQGSISLPGPRVGKTTLDNDVPLAQQGNSGNVADVANDPNNVYQGKTKEGRIIANLNNIKWSQNLLNDYRNCTYRFKLVACKEPFPNNYEMYNQRMANKDAHVIIAETGSTKYNITGVTIENKVANGWRNMNTSATNITINISEPYTSSLLDSFINACKSLYVENFMKVHYYLELSFIGYNDDGEPVSHVGFNKPESSDDQSQRLKNGFLLYRINILNVDTEINESGSRYVITALPQNEQALNDLIFRFASPITVKGPNVGEVFKKLEEALNDDVYKRYLGRQIYRYNIKCYDPEVLKAEPKSDGDPLKVPGTDDQQAGRGRTVADFIQSIIMNSKYAENFTELAENPKSYKDNFINTFKIYTTTEYTNDAFYDPTIGDYYKIVTYHVYRYKTLLPIASKDQHDEFVKRAQKIVDELNEKRLMVKRYDYLFTGKNSEVLAFDIRMNLNWASLTTVYSGKIRGYGAVANGQVYDENQAKYLNQLHNNYKQMSKIHEEYQKTRDLTSIQNDQTRQSLEESVRNALMDTGKYSVLINKMESEKTTINPQLIEEYKKANIKLNTAEVALQSYMSKQNLSKIASGAHQKYAEDIQLNDVTLTAMPITYHPNPQDTSNQYGMGNHGSRNEGKAVMASVFDQTYGMMEKELQNITMDIKGDPYWLGNTELDNPPNSNDAKSPNLYPSYILGDHCLLLNFKFPSGTDEDSGELIFNGKDSIFNGIYAVNHVTNTFSAGQFKQTIKASRVPVLLTVKV